MTLALERQHMIPDRIEREIHVSAPVERVWAVITEAKHLGTWFGDAGATIDLRPGGAMTVMSRATKDRAEKTAHFVVDRVDRPRFFSYRWLRSGVAEPTPANSTLVEFTLTPEADGTRIRVVESGFRTLDMSDERLAADIKGHTEGWKKEIDELAEYVAGVAE